MSANLMESNMDAKKTLLLGGEFLAKRAVLVAAAGNHNTLELR